MPKRMNGKKGGNEKGSEIWQKFKNFHFNPNKSEYRLPVFF